MPLIHTPLPPLHLRASLGSPWTVATASNCSPCPRDVLYHPDLYTGCCQNTLLAGKHCTSDCTSLIWKLSSSHGLFNIESLWLGRPIPTSSETHIFLPASFLTILPGTLSSRHTESATSLCLHTHLLPLLANHVGYAVRRSCPYKTLLDIPLCRWQCSPLRFSWYSLDL